MGTSGWDSWGEGLLTHLVVHSQHVKRCVAFQGGVVEQIGGFPYEMLKYTLASKLAGHVSSGALGQDGRHLICGLEGTSELKGVQDHL